jgi:hypothetical protein
MEGSRNMLFIADIPGSELKSRFVELFSAQGKGLTSISENSKPSSSVASTYQPGNVASPRNARIEMAIAANLIEVSNNLLSTSSHLHQAWRNSMLLKMN